MRPERDFAITMSGRMTLQKQYESGMSHYRAGRLAEAERIYRRILALQPNYADALHMLGVLEVHAGRLDAGIELIRQAITICSTRAIYYRNLGNVLKDKGQLDEAIVAYRQAIRLEPNSAQAHTNLGTALWYVKQLDEAIAVFRQVVRLQPDSAEGHNNLGNALMAMKQLDEAITRYRQAIQLKPDLAGAHSNLGNALRDIGQLDEAISSYRQAVLLNPAFSSADSCVLSAVHYHPDYDAGMIREELRRWNRAHAEPLKKFMRPHSNDRDPDRRLRIGYVSADFRRHALAPSLLPLFHEHDRGQVEIFCYSNLLRSDADEFTGRFQRYASLWRRIEQMSDSQAADLIRQDQIDILVDLALHTANNRLLIFARKPAPVQVTYLGYCSSTGLETMDYRLSDPHLDPLDSDLTVYSERTIRLAETFWCYNPCGVTPEPAASPAECLGYVTFGCLNSFAKISASLELWAEILQSVPESRLIVYSPRGAHLDSVRERFAGRGIAPDRLEFPGWQQRDDYLKTYGQIDIALDPFPWGGGITTCDALWMGVPVVSLLGRTAVGRGGASILANVGVPELIARTPREYVEIASGLAKDLPQMAELRRTLRRRMQASPLTDAPRFARNIEAAYRQMWRNWCANEAGG
jgi:protein O-GlcNAc transferase